MSVFGTGRAVLVPAIGAALAGVVYVGSKTRGIFRAHAEGARIADLQASELRKHRTDRSDALQEAREYQAAREAARTALVGRFEDWLDENGGTVERAEFGNPETIGDLLKDSAFDGRRPSTPNFTAPAVQGVFWFSRWAPEQVQHLVARFANASTGRPIKDLHGIARRDALSAFFGGGAKWAGGGGIAAGQSVMVVVRGIAVLASVGLLLHAKEKLAAAETARFRLDLSRSLASRAGLAEARVRIGELTDELARLVDRADSELTTLEALRFDPKQHEDQFELVVGVVAAVVQLPEVLLPSDDDVTAGQ